jgi:ribosomal protein S18 acetylase RimI-like enzyme
MEIKIRPAVEGDADTISELNAIVQAKHVKAVPWLFKDSGWTPDAVKAVLLRPETLMFIADVETESAGYVYAEARQFPDTSLTHAYGAAHVHHISVHDRFRRTGVGRALLAAVDGAARGRGIERLTADIWAFNDEAIGFFRNGGLSVYMLRHWR